MLNDDFDKQFDKQFARTQKLVGCGFVFNAVFALLILGGVGWLVYVLLAHFGVI